jgi:hypothetical protein
VVCNPEVTTTFTILILSQVGVTCFWIKLFNIQQSSNEEPIGAGLSIIVFRKTEGDIVCLDLTTTFGIK